MKKEKKISNKLILKRIIITPLGLGQLAIIGGDSEMPVIKEGPKNGPIRVPEPRKTNYTCAICGSAWLTCSPD